MKLACPACNATFSLDVVLAQSAARDAMAHALALPAPLGKLLLAYLGLFRPAKRQLTWERVATLLGELRAPIEAAQIERNGRAWPAPIGYWQAALETVLMARDAGKLTLPLKSHGYLFEVICGVANKSETKTENATYATRAGKTMVGTSASHQLMAPVAPVEQADMPADLKALLKRKPKGDAA